MDGPSSPLKILTPEQVGKLSPSDLEEYERHLEALYWAKGKTSFLDYCQMVELPGAPIVDEDEGRYFPETINPAAHHRLLIDAIQKLADGTYHDVDGVMAFMRPGSAKSSYLSVLGGSWLLGRKPGTNVIGTSYGQDLANRFGRRVRHVVRSDSYQKIMGCTIAEDNQAVDNWSLTSGSDYRAAGFGAAVTGFRADYLLIDDPVKSREDADSELIREKTWSAYSDDLVTRLKPKGKIIIAMTRWHEDDLAGRILGERWKGKSGLWRGTDGRLWLIINLPFEAEHADDPLGRERGEILWKEYFGTDEHKRLKEAAAKGGTAARTWSSLYQNRPAPNEGAILAKHYWRKWEKKDLPECSQIFLCYDTAFEEGEENDFSAMTAWGVFDHTSKKSTGEEYNHQHVILLGAWMERVSAVDLMDIAVTGYDAEDEYGRRIRVKSHCQLFTPDIVLVEKRASGIQLIQEMKRKRIPVKAWLPKGKPGAKGKLPRAHAIAVILEQGSVWYVPGTKTEAVLDQCAAFPFSTHDDACFVAGTLIALRRGLTPIEQVRVGDEALTPQGWRRVSASGFTGVKPVINRGPLHGTGNHPVFDLKSGYIPLESVDTVTMAKTVARATLWSLIRTIRRKPWNFSANVTHSWADAKNTTSHNQKRMPDEKAPRGCTLPYGNITMASMFRRATMSITKTAILSTAVLRIWIAYRLLSIKHCQKSILTMAHTWLTLSASAPSQWHGINRLRGVSGTGRMLSVQAHSERASLALGRTDLLVCETASSAGLNSSAEIRAGSYAATPVPVAKPVYNLTVEGAHCYYANGILVHNCDTVTMALAFFRDKWIFKTAEDELDEDELKEVLLARSDAARSKRRLYSGPVNRPVSDYDKDEIASMTPETRRRLYGGLGKLSPNQ